MAYVYLYDASWEGLLTCVFRAFETGEWPQAVLEEENAQIAFGQTPLHVAADMEKARRVERGILRNLGSALHQKAWTVFLSGDPNKSTILYRYLCTAFRTGRGIYNALAHDDVLAMDQLELQTTHEAQKLYGFVRFSRMENGVFYGKITPKNNVLPLLMPFFADRFSDQPLLLYDAVHHLAGVYDLREWYLIETAGIHLPDLAGDELTYRRMWKLFYKTISIAERENQKLRRSNMPKRYWPNMTEFDPPGRDSAG